MDRYQILELLGEGGMGRVYRAAHEVLAREYAIKVLYGDFASEPRFVERFRREAESISRIRHPNIVSVEDFGRTSEGLMFIVLELVRGRPLSKHLAQRGSLPPSEAASIVRQIVAGLGAAHRAGFVHRDIKPQNIMLGDDGSVKVLDFGSVSLQEPGANERLTIAGNIVGTPSYMAPEQSQDGPVGPAADFYSVGVVLYEMLTGVLPFRGRTRAEILVKHIAEPPPEAPPSDGLERLVAALLEKHAHARLSRADDVLALLDALDSSRLGTADTSVDTPLATLTSLIPDEITADLDEGGLAPSRDPVTATSTSSDLASAASTSSDPAPAIATRPSPVVAAPHADTAVANRAPPSPWSPTAESAPTMATDLEPPEPRATSPRASSPVPGPATTGTAAPRSIAPALAAGFGLLLLVLAALWYWGGEPVRVQAVPPRSSAP